MVVLGCRIVGFFLYLGCGMDPDGGPGVLNPADFLYLGCGMVVLIR